MLALLKSPCLVRILFQIVQELALAVFVSETRDMNVFKFRRLYKFGLGDLQLILHIWAKCWGSQSFLPGPSLQLCLLLHLPQS